MKKELYDKLTTWGEVLDGLRDMYGSLHIDLLKVWEEGRSRKTKEIEKDINRYKSGILIITSALAKHMKLNEEDIQESLVYLQKIEEEIMADVFED